MIHSGNASAESPVALPVSAAMTVTSLSHRLLSPLLLRELLLWLEGNKAFGSEAYPIGKGWLYAILLGISGYFSTLTHHQVFWSASYTVCQRQAACDMVLLHINSCDF